ncbi:MAG: XRE family transcriptional regulator [Bacteroides sp.]|nr:XRE family transcriptional regulator [Bacteroides sp.]MCM1456627.1 hypothetical protein [Lachnoclostridium sp.]
MQKTIGAMIRDELRRQERSVAWFARKICCSRTHAYKIFEKDNIDILLLARISRALGHNFFDDLSRTIGTHPSGLQK